MTKLLTLSVFLMTSLLSGNARSEEVSPCNACDAKIYSAYRSANYVEKAMAANSLEEKQVWLEIALRFDPENEDAKRLIRDLNIILPHPY